jgi:hypothetical protein
MAPRNRRSSKAHLKISQLRGLSTFIGAALVMAVLVCAHAEAQQNLLTVRDNAQLAAEPTTRAAILVRQDYAAGSGAPPLFFAASANACSLNGGRGDGGSQVPSQDSKCWLARFPASGIDVREFGAIGNGTTSDSTAIQSALSAANLQGGGIVWAPPTGAAYVISNGLTLGSGVHLLGAGGLNWAFNSFDNTESDWTGQNTWVKCQDTTNPCITVDGNGDEVRGINFWYVQPTPPHGTQCSAPCTFTTSWTPTYYPYTILVNGNSNFTRLWYLNIVNAYDCIDWEGPPDGIAGIYSSMEHMSLGCANVGTRFHLIDNTLALSDLRYEMWWYQGSSDWWGWLEGSGNHVDWDVEYLANVQASNIEFSFSGLAMKFTDATVGSGFGGVTFAAANMQLSNISFNEVCQGMAVANTTTHVTGNISNLILAADTTTSSVSGQCANQSGATNPSNFALHLASDNVNLFINGLNGSDVQGVAYIGGGGVGPPHGQLHVAQPAVQAYSAFQSNTPAFMTDSTGSVVDLTGLNWIHPSPSSGPVVSGNEVGAELGAPSLPPSCSSLPSGTLWNHSNVVSVCP